ncbi:alpha/beta hydrolase family protein [Pyxidicoccus sp. 3LFB2]
MSISGPRGTPLHRAILLVALLLGTSALAEAPGVGFRELTMKDPVGGGPMGGLVFYPATQPSEPLPVSLWRVDAGREQELVPGRYPLVLISHGHGGTRWGHHNLATALAREGFVVASLDHPGASFKDANSPAAGTDEVWLGRAAHMKTLLDTVLADATVGPSVDPARVGALGFSAGGYTVLLLAGAKPDFGRLERHCKTRKQAVLCGMLPKVRVTRPDLQDTAEPRVRAVFTMAPVGVFYDKAGLKGVKVPVRLYAAAKDEVLPVADHAGHIRASLPKPPEYALVPRAGHYVFMAPCIPEAKEEAQELCMDPPGVDRVKLHRELATDAVRFFTRTLAAAPAKP